ncbi:uncharacterized protein LOC111581556 [Amphiprion ocellaris]|uniref:uncharacterized protein LOC111581556 n=1 Tax=Amphiprion ocellaris TaxID=80972 RepID=UPI000C31B7C0|nr:uncharacterized protein LOC111581556 [Amphiprion ocellaris]
MVQLTSKMATWGFVSQLLLIALLSWNVHCFPAKNAWSWNQHNPDGSGLSNMEGNPDLGYSSPPPNFPPPPNDPNDPAVSFLYDGPTEGDYSPSGTYPASFTSTPDMYGMTSALGPMEESAATYLTSGTSQPQPHIGFPPRPPVFQAGELDRFEGSSVHGNLEKETEEMGFVPPLPYPEPPFKGGELSNYASTFEHGNTERETEDQGFTPGPPHMSAQLSSAFSPEGDFMQPFSQPLEPFGPNLFDLFLSGQHPPGTLSHFQTEYENGGDHQDDVHYERYNFPDYQTLVPSDGFLQQPQKFPKFSVV